jgi:hypothetical protein
MISVAGVLALVALLQRTFEDSPNGNGSKNGRA